MNGSKTEIMLARDTDADDICQNIHDNLLPYIANTTAYGATVASNTNLQKLITAYSALIGRPALQKSVVRNATITLAQHFAAANALLKNQLDALMMQYKISNEDFYNQYLAVRVINDIGHRHAVILSGFIYTAVGEIALAGAKVSLIPGPSQPHPPSGHLLQRRREAEVIFLEKGVVRKKITDATGHYKFTRLHAGTYTLTVRGPETSSGQGFVTQTKTISVTQNGTVHNDFTMVEKVTPNPNNNTSTQ